MAFYWLARCFGKKPLIAKTDPVLCECFASKSEHLANTGTSALYIRYIS